MKYIGIHRDRASRKNNFDNISPINYVLIIKKKKKNESNYSTKSIHECNSDLFG